MYELKRLGEKYGYRSRKSPTAKMARCFVKTIDLHGRNAEGELLARYFLSTNPFRALRLIGFGLRMLIRGRAPFLPHGIKDTKNLRKMISALSQEE